MGREWAWGPEAREPRAFALGRRRKPDRENQRSRHSPPTRYFFSRGPFPQSGSVPFFTQFSGLAADCVGPLLAEAVEEHGCEGLSAEIPGSLQEISIFPSGLAQALEGRSRQSVSCSTNGNTQYRDQPHEQRRSDSLPRAGGHALRIIQNIIAVDLSWTREGQQNRAVRREAELDVEDAASDRIAGRQQLLR
jgi:hypothetical protein